jgi:ferredoxin
MGYLANYGYTDGSGDWYIRINTELCDGCGDCVTACPVGVFELVEDEFDPLSDEVTASVNPEHRKTIKYDCGPCKPVADRPSLPCVVACQPGAIAHSW